MEFSFKADESHPPAPPDLTRIDFTSTDGVEILASPQSSTVVQAYNRYEKKWSTLSLFFMAVK